MKIQLTALTQDFLLKDDPDGKSTVTIRQASAGDAIHLVGLFSKQRRVWNDEEVGKMSLEYDWNHEQLKRERAFLTLVGADLESEDGVPIFKFTEQDGELKLAMTKNQFYKVWDQLSIELTDEIHDHILSLNPQWSPEQEEE